MTSSTVFHFALLVKSIDETYKKALQFGAKKFGFPGWDGTPTSVNMLPAMPLDNSIRNS